MKAILDNVPDKYQDSITCDCMLDPVELPGCGIIVDRSTIKQHITLNGETNPFNNQKLTLADLIECTDLKKEIHAYIDAEIKKKNLQSAKVNFDQDMMIEGQEDGCFDGENPDENSNTMFLDRNLGGPPY